MSITTGTSASSTCSHKLIGLLPTLSTDGPEVELLDSLGDDFVTTVANLLKHSGTPYTPSDEKLIAGVITVLSSDPHEPEVARDILHLTALLSPLITPTQELIAESKGIEVSVETTLEIITSLYERIRAYWECGAGQLYLEIDARAAYARGAFLLSLADNTPVLPVTVADDIHLRFMGTLYTHCSTDTIRKIMDSGALLYDLFSDHADEDLSDDYNEQMESNFPLLTFSTSSVDSCALPGNIDADDVTVDIGGIRVDSDCAYVLNRIARNRGFEDASQTAFFKLAEVLIHDERAEGMDRLLLTAASEWSEEECLSLLEMYLELTNSQRDIAFGEVSTAGSMPRVHGSHGNYLECIHAFRMAPLIAAYVEEMDIHHPIRIVRALSLSAVNWEDTGYTFHHDMIAKGLAVKCLIENDDHAMNNPQEESYEVLHWLGEHAFELAPHAKLLHQHGRVNQELYAAVLSNSAKSLGSGLL